MSFVNVGLSNVIGADLKSQFVATYGVYSTNFIHLDPLGNQKINTQWPILVVIVGVILSVLTWVGSKPSKNEKTGKDNDRTIMQKFLFGLSWLFMLCSVFGVGYGSYLYFLVYLPEYFKWFEILPIDAKTRLGMISTISNIKYN